MKNLIEYKMFENDEHKSGSDLYDNSKTRYKALEVIESQLDEHEVDALLDENGQHIESILNGIDCHPYDSADMAKFVQAIRDYGI